VICRGCPNKLPYMLKTQLVMFLKKYGITAKGTKILKHALGTSAVPHV
jgi:hypothetical protein